MTIAEESTAWPGVTRPTHLGGLGFGFSMNLGWMHDTLEYLGLDPIYRAGLHDQVTSPLSSAFSENYVLPLSHDEVVHGKGSLWERMQGDAWNKAAGVRALLAFMWAHPGKQLLFMGGEFGQAREWSAERSLDWDLLGDPLHGGIKTMVGDLNRVYKESSALWTRDNTPEGFSWIDANDATGNVLSFLRHGVDADGNPTVLACIANFSGGPRDDYRVGLPFAGRWREVLNTDAEVYGGSGVGNLGAVQAEPDMWHGRPASAALRLPPSGVLWLAPEPLEEAARTVAAVREPDLGVERPLDHASPSGSPVAPQRAGRAPAPGAVTLDPPDVAAVIAVLEARVLPTSAILTEAPVAPGLYAWWASPTILPELNGLAHPAQEGLRLLYVGAATKLRSRLGHNHMKRTGSSTLRRTLAGLLLDDEAFRTRWTDRVVLVAEDEVRLTSWMETNLRVSWCEHPTPGDVETAVIRRLAPPLNVDHVSGPAREKVEAARRRYYVSAGPRPTG
jgi:1,4-alpha-glucan branching enzyme